MQQWKWLYKPFVLCHNWYYQRESITEILPGLWIGDMTSGPYYKQFDCIIDCTPDLELGSLYKRLPDYRLNLYDIVRPDSQEYWQRQHNMLKAMKHITPIIDQYLSQGEKVLVHCRAGKQRSAAIIAAYLVRYQRQTPAEAIMTVQAKVPGGFKPYCNFKWALNSLEI